MIVVTSFTNGSVKRVFLFTAFVFVVYQMKTKRVFVIGKKTRMSLHSHTKNAIVNRYFIWLVYIYFEGN